MKTLLATVAASGLALAQPAAAATRSYESLPQAGAQVAPADRIGTPVDEAEANGRGLPIWVILLIFAAVAAAIAASTGSKSPG
ncbi:MAG: hypothetical protein ABIT16_06540 [Croceibacterium sp.]